MFAKNSTLKLFIIVCMFCAAPIAASNLDQESWPRKGGVGVISDDIYILLDHDRNGMTIAGTDWTGKPYSESEVLLTDGKRVLTEKDDLSCNTLRVVIFTPNKVRYIDYKHGQAGYYKRIHRKLAS